MRAQSAGFAVYPPISDGMGSLAGISGLAKRDKTIGV